MARHAIVLDDEVQLCCLLVAGVAEQGFMFKLTAWLRGFSSSVSGWHGWVSTGEDEPGYEVLSAIRVLSTEHLNFGRYYNNILPYLGCLLQVVPHYSHHLQLDHANYHGHVSSGAKDGFYNPQQM